MEKNKDYKVNYIIFDSLLIHRQKFSFMIDEHWLLKNSVMSVLKSNDSISCLLIVWKCHLHIHYKITANELHHEAETHCFSTNRYLCI